MNSPFSGWRYSVRLVWNQVKLFFSTYKKILLLWMLIGLFVIVSLLFHVDKHVIAVIVVIFGIISQAFVGLISLIGVVPLVGPLLAKVLALPLYWILNALGYFVSIIAIKKGFGKEVLNTRVLTVVFLVGVALGYVLGKIF